MIDPLLLIGGLLITLLSGLPSIWQIRGYLRTGLKSYLYRGLTFLVFLFMILGMPIVAMISDSLGGRHFGEHIFIIIMGALFVTAYYFLSSAWSSTLYDEKVAWQQVCEETTYWQRLTGNLPIVEQKKPRPIPISRRSGLILGILSATSGTMVTVPFILFKFPIVSIIFSVAAIYVLILGLLLIIFSIICLEKDRKHS